MGLHLQRKRSAYWKNDVRTELNCRRQYVVNEGLDPKWVSSHLIRFQLIDWDSETSARVIRVPSACDRSKRDGSYRETYGTFESSGFTNLTAQTRFVAQYDSQSHPRSSQGVCHR